MFLANLDVSAAELAGFQPLLQALDQAGVEVRFDQPPRAGGERWRSPGELHRRGGHRFERVCR